MEPLKTTLRFYQPSDYQAVIALVKELLDYERHYYSDRVEGEANKEKYFDDLRNWLQKEQGILVVAKSGGEIVGYSAGHTETEVENVHAMFYIDDLVVTKEYRGQGVGKALLAFMENYAKNTLHLKKLGIGVLVNNHPALNVYKRFGFEEYGLELMKNIE